MDRKGGWYFIIINYAVYESSWDSKRDYTEGGSVNAWVLLPVCMSYYCGWWLVLKNLDNVVVVALCVCINLCSLRDVIL